MPNTSSDPTASGPSSPVPTAAPARTVDRRLVELQQSLKVLSSISEAAMRTLVDVRARQSREPDAAQAQVLRLQKALWRIGCMASAGQLELGRAEGFGLGVAGSE